MVVVANKKQEKKEEKEEEEEGRKEGGEATNIKSNNPHLAGREIYRYTHSSMMFYVLIHRYCYRIHLWRLWNMSLCVFLVCM